VTKTYYYDHAGEGTDRWKPEEHPSDHDAVEKRPFWADIVYYQRDDGKFVVVWERASSLRICGSHRDPLDPL